MATNANIKNPWKYNKRQLCEMLDIEFKVQNKDGHKHLLTNIQTEKEEEFKSVNSIATKLNIDCGKIINRARTGKPLNVNGVNYIVKKLET